MNLRLVSVAIALVASAMLLGAGVYESVAVAPNFQGAPTSLEHARGFYHATNPGMFFRVLSPAVQLFLLVALVCNWKRPGTRWRLAGALALAILADVITFKFHYPRNTILFLAPLTGQAADLDRVATEWAAGNYVRIALIVTAVVLSFAHTLGEFGVVLMVGGNLPGITRTASIDIYDRVQSMDYAEANRMALVLLIISFVVLSAVYGVNRQIGRRVWASWAAR